ncbi:CBS domain-containing protein [Thermoleophilia bacterium SCSIO 60948]|nr:CBS domain-containing protein [Thermoleophilia bacterium SCSIO 60948]
MQVRDGMTELMLTVGPAHSLRQAAQQMTERGVGAALVIDEESPAPGIVSERDVMKALAAGSDPDKALVADHMSDSLIVAAPDWSLERAAVEMSERHIRHLIVVDGGEPVGVLSIRDIVRVWTSEGATSAMTSPEQERSSSN